MAELAAEIARDPTRPVLLCSPNNPTGAAIEPAALAGLLESLQAPLLLDNAYAEFSQLDYRPLLARFPNLVVFRTFSKAWSIGGMRLGYLLADPGLVAELLKLKLPYNLSHAAIATGLAVLEASHVAHRRVRVLLGRRDQWVTMLESFGLDVAPSRGQLPAGQLAVASRRRRRRCGRDAPDS